MDNEMDKNEVAIECICSYGGLGPIEPDCPVCNAMVFKRDRIRNRVLHRIFPKHTVYSTFSWRENFLGGHKSIGPIVLYGENAMHWAINIKSRWGYICFRLPFKCFDRWWPVYFYVSHDATPQSATFWLYGRKARGF